MLTLTAASNDIMTMHQTATERKILSRLLQKRKFFKDETRFMSRVSGSPVAKRSYGGHMEGKRGKKEKYLFTVRNNKIKNITWYIENDKRSLCFSFSLLKTDTSQWWRERRRQNSRGELEGGRGERGERVERGSTAFHNPRGLCRNRPSASAAWPARPPPPVLRLRIPTGKKVCCGLSFDLLRSTT